MAGTGPKKGKGGRPPTAIEKKRRRGTDRADRDGKPGELRAVAPVNTSDILELTVEQALERSLTAGSYWISESDSTSVVAAREATEFYAELKANPQCKPSDRLAAFKVMTEAFRDLGFTPGERSRLGLAEVQAKSKLEELRERTAAHNKDQRSSTG